MSESAVSTRRTTCVRTSPRAGSSSTGASTTEAPGATRVVIAASNFLGPFTAGLVIDHGGYRLAFLVMALLPLVCWYWVRTVQELPPVIVSPQQPKSRAWDLVTEPLFRRLLRPTLALADLDVLLPHEQAMFGSESWSRWSGRSSADGARVTIDSGTGDSASRRERSATSR